MRATAVSSASLNQNEWGVRNLSLSVIVPCSFFVLIFILHFLISLSIKLYLHGANAQHRSSHDTLSRSRKYSLIFFFYLQRHNISFMSRHLAAVARKQKHCIWTGRKPFLLTNVSLSWESDPSSAALPEISSIFIFPPVKRLFSHQHSKGFFLTWSPSEAMWLWFWAA